MTAGTLDAATWQQYIDIMNIPENGMFSYLVIYTGINAAQVFGATPTLGGVIGAVVMLTGMNPEAPLKLYLQVIHWQQVKGNPRSYLCGMVIVDRREKIA